MSHSLDPVCVLNHPPAKILAQALIDIALATNPLDQEDWPVYANNLPPTPHEVICVTDTTGTFDGRYMNTGEVVEFPGIQIRVRTTGERYERGWRKMRQLREELPKILRRAVTLEDDSYLLQNVTLTSPVTPMGQDPDTQRRQNFSLNARLTIST